MSGAFSPEMVGVYLSAITLVTLIVNKFFDLRKERMRREWEVEDRREKALARKQLEEAKRAAAAAARLAEKSNRAVQESRGERHQQIEEIKADIKASTATASAALSAANNTNDKILKATEMAAKALDHAASAIETSNQTTNSPHP